MTEAEFLEQLDFLGAHYPANTLPDLSRCGQTYYEIVKNLDDNHVVRVFNFIVNEIHQFPTVAAFQTVIKTTRRVLADRVVDQILAEGLDPDEERKKIDRNHHVIPFLKKERKSTPGT